MLNEIENEKCPRIWHARVNILCKSKKLPDNYFYGNAIRHSPPPIKIGDEILKRNNLVVRLVADLDGRILMLALLYYSWLTVKDT